MTFAFRVFASSFVRAALPRRSPRWLGPVSALALILAMPTDAHAFKTRTHVVAANETIRDIEAHVSIDGNLRLIFEVNGQRFPVDITAMDAYQAIVDWPEYYRAGAIAPDSYPDTLTGQMLMHGDHSESILSLNKQVTGLDPARSEPWEPLSERRGPATFRAIDFATEMLRFWRADDWGATSPSEREQAFAFIMGYLSHGVGDSFAHTWVNELANGAWSFKDGEGTFGPLTEEVKHTAIEVMVDLLTPPALRPQAELVIRTPQRFLDAFYASRAFRAEDFGNPNGGFESWSDYYKNIDQFYGGPFYSYFNAQVAAPSALKRWSGFSQYLDFAEDANDSRWVNFGLDVAELHAEVHDKLTEAYPNVADQISFITGGMVDCHIGGLDPNQNAVEEFREVFDLIGQTNDRLETLTEKAKVVRRNYLLLNECTAQNLMRTTLPDWSVLSPDQNTDACADLVRQGWQDQTGGLGLYRGSIRPVKDGEVQVDNVEFLTKLKAAFLGGDAEDLFGNSFEWQFERPDRNGASFDHADTLEETSRHRSIGDNFKRVLNYLKGPGFSLQDLPEVVLPERAGEMSPRDRLHAACATARSGEFERCLNLALAPAREAWCKVEHVQCIKDYVPGCAKAACHAACSVPWPASEVLSCDDVCGQRDSNTCTDIVDGLFLCNPFTPCLPGHGTAISLCGLVDNKKNTCEELAIQEATVCGPEDFYCSTENLYDLVTGEGWGDEVLRPVRQACDLAEDTLAMVDCLKGEVGNTEAERDLNREVCVVDLCVKAGGIRSACQRDYDDIQTIHASFESIARSMSVIADNITQDPYAFVNFAFLKEDIADPVYRQQIATALASALSSLTPPPPGASDAVRRAYNETKEALEKFDELFSGGFIPEAEDALNDIANASTQVANYVRVLSATRVIPNVPGPTAIKVLRAMGPSFLKTFLPFFNTVQGMKLLPMNAEVDLHVLFEREELGMSLLPWNTSADYSAECDFAEGGILCDVMKSFDDPNCLNCDFPDPRFSQHGWVPGRGLVAFNKYDPSNPQRNVLTNLPIAATQEAYDAVYRKIFAIPEAVPIFAGFEDPDRLWTSEQATLSIDTDGSPLPTQGAGTLMVEGCGWREIKSPEFSTTEFGVLGSKLLVDVYLPIELASSSWVGDIQAFVNVPGVTWTAQLPPWRGFTGPGIKFGEWNTISFDVPDGVRDTLLNDHSRAQISFQGSWADCGYALHLDNLRFSGTLHEREIFHVRGSDTYSVVVPDVFSFDLYNDWTSSAARRQETENVVQGFAALALQVDGWTPIRSRLFSVSEIPAGAVTDALSLDLYIPGPQDARVYWMGDVQAAITCRNSSAPPGAYSFSEYLGYQSLALAFQGEYNSLVFDNLPAAALSRLRGQAAESQCYIELAVNSSKAGEYFLDNLGFVQP